MRKIYIYVLTLTSLPNDKHMAIVDYMAKALHLYSVAGTIVSRFVEAFLAAYDNENKAYQRIDRKELTKRMNEADTDRINALRIIRDALKIFLIMKNEQKNVAATRILDTIDLYGGADIYNMPVDSRTGVLNNLVEDLEGPLGEAVRVLDIEPAVENLKAANELFLQCQSDRNLSDADYGKGAMAEARAATDRIWRALVEEVNNAIAYGTAEDREALVPFVKYMNVEIDKYRIQTGQGVGGSTASGSGSTEEDEETVRTKMATFKFADGRTEGFPVEVGTVLIAPTNTEGYKWKPDVPEFMPATNKTFKEVPIEDKEAVATFHFFDHTEEEIRQLVGTLLHAPENTAGYYWDPEVPEVMPAEDTSYYELPEEGEQEEPKYKVTYMKGSEVFAEQEYEAGEVIHAPEPPAGYDWEEYPYRMPANDITVNAVRKNVPGGGGGSGFE